MESELVPESSMGKGTSRGWIHYVNRLLTKSAVIGRVRAGIAMICSCMLLQQYVSTCSPIEVGKTAWSRDKL
jgi:hypothetical protein